MKNCALKNKNAVFIIACALFCSILMCVADGVLKLPYLQKSLLKICVFVLLPTLYLLSDKQRRRGLVSLFLPRRKSLVLAFSLGIAVLALILCAYFLLSDVIDFSKITESLTSGVGVGKENFVFVAIYISFVNSLIEEFFFRGFSFSLLKRETTRGFAYVFSSACFAVYHAGMTSGWFNIGLYILTFGGLFVGGCIFDYLNEKGGSIYPSYITHMFANFAINFIGLIMFGII